MKLKKKLLKKSRLYVIVERNLIGKRALFNLVNKIKHKGIDIIQLRDKQSTKDVILRDAFRLNKLLLNTKTIFIVNDYLDVAKIVDSDGFHLGQFDIPIEIARRILGKNKLIGVSCHNLKQALKAQSQGADYISIGPIFSTPIKPKYPSIGLDLIKALKKKIKIPFFAIGGINQNNIDEIISLGVKRVAVSRAICKAKNIQDATKKLFTVLH